jgi:hypothetical protein
MFKIVFKFAGCFSRTSLKKIIQIHVAMCESALDVFQLILSCLKGYVDPVSYFKTSIMKSFTEGSSVF